MEKIYDIKENFFQDIYTIIDSNIENLGRLDIELITVDIIEYLFEKNYSLEGKYKESIIKVFNSYWMGVNNNLIDLWIKREKEVWNYFNKE